MKTRCPSCQTIFRVTPDQLRTRVGRVRCGQCLTVFNGLDHLLLRADQSIDETIFAPSPQIPKKRSANPVLDTESVSSNLPENLSLFSAERRAEIPLSPPAEHAFEHGDALIFPREMSELAGYSKWTEGMISPLALLRRDNQPSPVFWVVAVLLSALLAAQIGFYLRSEIAIAWPSLRPSLTALSHLIGSDLPLAQRMDLLSIEASGLENDPARGNLLVLNATLRNRANYAQAYPLLELSLTNAQNITVMRRVLAPQEYLPAREAARQAFAPNTDIAIHLWLDAKKLNATGYLLYVFYPQ